MRGIKWVHFSLRSFTTRLSLFFLALLCSVSVCLPFVSLTANAASAYDNAIVRTDGSDGSGFKIGTRRGGVEYTQSTITSYDNWYNPTYFKTALSYTSNAPGVRDNIDNFLSVFADHSADGSGYAVTTYHNTDHVSDYEDTLSLYIFDEDAGLCMDTTGMYTKGYIKVCTPGTGTYGSNIVHMTLFLNGDSGGSLAYADSGGIGTGEITTQGISPYTDPAAGVWLIATDHMTYPDGYAGDDATAPVVPPTHVDYQPDLNIVSAAGYNLILQDRNFNTFDDVPFTCTTAGTTGDESGTTPVMYYELHSDPTSDDPDITLDSGVMSPTVQYTYSLPHKAANYTVVAWYSCGNSAIFDNSTFLHFQMTNYGTLTQDVCDSDVGGIYCQINKSFNIGIISSTVNGLIGVIDSLSIIDPSSCQSGWATDMGLNDSYIGLQNMPASVCTQADGLYLDSGSPFHALQTYMNILLAGGSIMLVVFGVLSILGVRVRLPSPISESDGSTQPGANIPISPSISRHKGTYSSGSSSRSKTGRGL